MESPMDSGVFINWIKIQKCRVNKSLEQNANWLVRIVARKSWDFEFSILLKLQFWKPFFSFYIFPIKTKFCFKRWRTSFKDAAWQYRISKKECNVKLNQKKKIEILLLSSVCYILFRMLFFGFVCPLFSGRPEKHDPNRA
jgi:hypothetical protein